MKTMGVKFVFDPPYTCSLYHTLSIIVGLHVLLMKSKHDTWYALSTVGGRRHIDNKRWLMNKTGRFPFHYDLSRLGDTRVKQSVCCQLSECLLLPETVFTTHDSAVIDVLPRIDCRIPWRRYTGGPRRAGCYITFGTVSTERVDD